MATRRLSGAEEAREILDRSGRDNVPVGEISGHLTDHYDPTKRALFLSSDNYHGPSIAAVGVAAHESGHARRQQAAYAPMNLRMLIVPVTQFSSYAWMGILLLGMFLGGAYFAKFMYLAIAILSMLTLFQLVTLPVEFDASRRAKEQLMRLGIVSSRENDDVSRVRGAAALTYVAALVASVLQLLHLLSIAQRRN